MYVRTSKLKEYGLYFSYFAKPTLAVAVSNLNAQIKIKFIFLCYFASSAT